MTESESVALPLGDAAMKDRYVAVLSYYSMFCDFVKWFFCFYSCFLYFRSHFSAIGKEAA